MPDDPTYETEEEVTLSGTGFGSGGAGKIMIGDEEVTATSVTDTSIVFDIPMLKHGTYLLLVNPNNQGYAGAFDITVALTINTVTPDTFSKKGD